MVAMLAMLANDELRGMARRIVADERRGDWRPTELVQESSASRIGEALGVSVRTVINDWKIARAWLYRELSNRLR